jgi:competence protein ComEA
MSFQSAKQASGSGNREAKGFLFLIAILLLPFLIQYTYRALFYTPKKIVLPVTYLNDTCETKKEYSSYSYPAKAAAFTGAAKSSNKVTPTYASVELNAADSAALETLPGIGPAFAARIIKYRSLLGGYLKVEQLKEVYGMPEETYERIKPLCTLSTTAVKMIPAETLWKTPYKFYHPYLSKELKAAINAKQKTEAYSEAVLKTLIEGSDTRLGWYVKW